MWRMNLFLSKTGYRKKVRNSTVSLQMERQLPTTPEFPTDSLAVDDVPGAKYGFLQQEDLALFQCTVPVGPPGRSNW